MTHGHTAPINEKPPGKLEAILDALRTLLELIWPSQKAWVFQLTAEEYRSRLVGHQALSDPALVAMVNQAETALGIEFRGGPLTSFHKRAAVVQHLLNPEDARFHTSDVEFYLRTYRAKEAVGGWPHPTSPRFPSPLQKQAALIEKRV